MHEQPLLSAAVAYIPGLTKILAKFLSKEFVAQHKQIMVYSISVIYGIKTINTLNLVAVPFFNMSEYIFVLSGWTEAAVELGSGH